MFYIIVVLISMVIITLVNYLFFVPFFSFTLLEIILAVTLAVVAVIAVDAILALIVRRLLPEKWFGVENTVFTPSKKRTIFYEKLSVKKWKDLVPDLGALTGFRKNKISDPKNNEFVGRYILEANFGIAVHLSNMFGGFLIVLFYLPYALCILLPVAFVNFILNYMSFITLRYNLPKLKSLYKYNQRNAEKNSKK